MENEKKCKVWHIITIVAICLSLVSILFSSFTLGFTLSKRNECPMPMKCGTNFRGANKWNGLNGASADDVKKWWTEYGRPFITEEAERTERLGPNDNQKSNKKKNFDNNFGNDFGKDLGKDFGKNMQEPNK